MLGVADAIDLALAADSGANTSDEDVGGLSPRQVGVLRLLAAGSSNQEIAECLSISRRAANNHVFGILAKLGLPTRMATAAYACQIGLA
jgi:DNA-binding NarL/FixJ family response regulator